MGIKNLTKLIRELAPGAIKERDLKAFNGRKIAIDASMAIYQFLVAIRSAAQAGGASVQLTNDAGEVTSHLQGILWRTLRLLDNGVKPVWVFDGKPPEMKMGELRKRKSQKAKAESDLKKATEEGKVEDIDKFAKRTVRMTSEHSQECMKLLKLMGMPVVHAPCEAEAQCAELAKKGKVWAAASEDMDTLCFATPTLIRRLTVPESKKLPCLEISLPVVLEELDLSMRQFVSVCMLSGCDYLPPIKGIGGKKALAGIKKHGNIEAFLESIDRTKYKVPEPYPVDQARYLFDEAVVTDGKEFDFKWGSPDIAGMKQFLCAEKGFNEARIDSAIKRLQKARKRGTQMRLGDFFAKKPVDKSQSKKRSKENKHGNSKKKKKKVKK